MYRTAYKMNTELQTRTGH